ncbi:MAG: serine/threonine-protein phosphatase [Deltaproteobacteria bacterium]|nr:serine/threonine-protein phosphatase [Deltaproteobacteria bacterium]
MTVAPGSAILIYSGFHTEVGNARERNDDALHQSQVPLGYLVALADPMGEQGDRAGTLTVEAIGAELEKEDSDAVEGLRRAFVKANQTLRAEAKAVGTAMGATCVAALISNGKLYTAHVGDARLYLLRGASLYSLTRDHSLMQELVDLKGPGAATEFAPTLKYIMSRSVGAEDSINVTMRAPIPLRAGDVILLCTDGLTGVVPDDRIRRTLAGATPREAAKRLIEIAHEAGAEDNATAMVLRVDAEVPPTEGTISFDDLTGMFVRTADGDLHPIVDAIINPMTWTVSAIRLDLRNVERGATCEISISQVGPLTAGEQVIHTPQCTEALLDLARGRPSGR